MLEGVLPVTGAELEPAQQLYQLGVQLHAQLEGCLLAGVLDIGVHFLLSLGCHLLDTRRVDASVEDKAVQGDAGNLAPDRVEAGNRYRLRRIVDNKVDARCLLQRPDIASFPSDKPALHLVVGQGYNRYRGLRDDFRGAALYGRGQYLLRYLVGLFLQLGFPLVETPRGFLLHFDLHGVEQRLFSLRAGHPGDEFQLLKLLVLEFSQLPPGVFYFLFLVGQVAVALFHPFQLAVQCLLFLVQSVFLSLQFGAPLPVVAIGGRLDSFGFFLCFLQYILGFVPGFANHLGCLSLGDAQLAIEDETAGKKSRHAAKDYPNDKNEEEGY